MTPRAANGPSALTRVFVASLEAYVFWVEDLARFVTQALSPGWRHSSFQTPCALGTGALWEADREGDFPCCCDIYTESQAYVYVIPDNL